jgi:hypothetical protein
MFTHLVELKAFMWEGFEDQVCDEVAKAGVRRGMERQLVEMRASVGSSRKQKGREDGTYEASRIGLV